VNPGAWIRVEDQMPEGWRRILVVVRRVRSFPPREVTPGMLMTLQNIRGEEIASGWQVAGWDGWVKFDVDDSDRQITHWQPLPDLPSDP